MRFLLAAVTLLSLAWAEPALACTCATAPVSADIYRRWFDGADNAVFQGTVLRKEEQAEFWKVTFRVERHWKGVTASDVAIYTQRFGSMCGVSLTVGRTYLMAAERAGDRLLTNLCLQRFIAQNTTLFREAIGEGTAGSSPPSR